MIGANAFRLERFPPNQPVPGKQNAATGAMPNVCQVVAGLFRASWQERPVCFLSGALSLAFGLLC